MGSFPLKIFFVRASRFRQKAQVLCQLGHVRKVCRVHNRVWRRESPVVGPAEHDRHDVVLEHGAQLLGQVVGADFVLQTQVEVVLWQEGIVAASAQTSVAFERAARAEDVDLDVLLFTQLTHKLLPLARRMAVAHEPDDLHDLLVVALQRRVVGYQSRSAGPAGDRNRETLFAVTDGAV